MHLPEAEAGHDDAHLARGETATHHAAVQELADHARVHQRHLLARRGPAQPRAYQLLLVALYAEGLVLPLHAPLLVGVEPVAEALPQFVAQLGVELVVVEAPRAGVVDVVHLMAEPAPVARLVAEEPLLVARAAEGGQSVLLLAEAGVGPTLLHLLAGGQRLQFRDVAGRLQVYLLYLHQTVLGQCQVVVLRREGVVGVLPEVHAQLRGQQVAEEGGLVDALGADEYKNLVVRREVAHPRGHRRHQPLVQRPLEILRLLGRDVTAQFLHAVATVPRGQCLDVLAHGVGQAREVGVEHVAHVLFQHALARVCRYLSANGAEHPLVELQPIGCVLDHEHRLVRHEVIHHFDALAEPLANLGQGDHRRLLLLAPLPVEEPRAVLLRLLVATADGGLALLRVVVAPLLRRPRQEFVLVGPVAVEEERRVHHVVVVVAALIGHLPPCQRLLHAGPSLVHRHGVGACRILLARLALLAPSVEVGLQYLLVGDDECLGLPVHVHLVVVRHPAQPRVVGTLRVVVVAR